MVGERNGFGAEYYEILPCGIDSLGVGIYSLDLKQSNDRSLLPASRFCPRWNRSRGACVANDSTYGNSGPSGVVSAVGSLFPRGAKANVAAYSSGRGASCQRPGYQPRF
ncbi:hypothetical protein PIB30_043355 [Stylosanthes scabra]|uniref:Uncharacterized protein n=1 Tax=Stylosanthes scabra TaxID=79078 RepID=A0ABU6WE24_9FABA|nr:hypothetical protein [Stylosanthes scabra]